MNIPLFLDKHCHLPSINNNGISNSTPSPTWVADSESSFPFTEQESSNICLKASLVVSRAFRNLSYLDTQGQSYEGGPLTGRSMPLSGESPRRYPHTILFFVAVQVRAAMLL